jgi:hypothetical protein
VAVLAYGAAKHSVNADTVVKITVSIAVRGIGYLTGTFHGIFISFSIFHGIPPAFFWFLWPNSHTQA